jgi:dihydroneopterin aldolase
MALISIENMEFWAHHGCFDEEQIIGNRFLVDVHFQTDTALAEESDKLSETVNYQRVYELVKQEMGVTSKLLEHVARRIADAIRTEFPEIGHLEVKVAKMNPPLGGKVEAVRVAL